MPASDYGRRLPPAAQVLLGALLAGTALYIVPTLVLSGAIVTAVVAAAVWLGGTGALWYLYRRDLRSAARQLAAEREAHRLYHTLIEHGAEAHVVVRPDGAIAYASPNVTALLGVDPESLDERGGLIDLVRRTDRRRALEAFARVRRSRGATAALEVGIWHSDGSVGHLDVHAANLVESPEVRGILVTLRDITPRKTIETEIQHLAYYDALTGLANRRFLVEQGATALSQARRRGGGVAVLYVDLDRFRDVNDVLGHEGGDRLLRQVAACLRDDMREADIVARVGGDEFALVLPDVADAAAAGRIADRLLRGLPDRVERDGAEVPVGASVGVAVFPADGDGIEALLEAADLAMHRAKSEGAGVQFHRPGLRTAFLAQRRLETELREALEHHEFRLHYQPVLDLGTGAMAGAEALARWRHVTRGLVGPDEFVGLAERSGLIRSLDRWVIARATRQRAGAATWGGWVSVNLSPLSLTDPGLPGYIRRALEEAALPPEALVLELQESAVLAGDDTAGMVGRLRDTGVRVALDDFGVVGASPALLRSLPIDILELHGDLVAGIGAPEIEQLLRATISLAHGTGTRVLAKGVEKEDQLAWLRDAGCDFAQGWATGEPVPPETLAARRGARAGQAARD